MMNRAFKILAKEGVSTPIELRNAFGDLKFLLRKGWVAKKRRGAKVYYELTEKSLPLLNLYRLLLLNQAKLETYWHSKNQQLRGLLGDLRFLNPASETAEKYQLLGDWQLRYEVLSNHLKLAHLQYYEKKES